MMAENPGMMVDVFYSLGWGIRGIIKEKSKKICGDKKLSLTLLHKTKIICLQYLMSLDYDSFSIPMNMIPFMFMWKIAMEELSLHWNLRLSLSKTKG